MNITNDKADKVMELLAYLPLELWCLVFEVFFPTELQRKAYHKRTKAKAQPVVTHNEAYGLPKFDK